MPDPHLLYIVSAVVVLALVAWVIVVLARAPVLPQAPARRESSGSPRPPASLPTSPPASPPVEPAASGEADKPEKSRPGLDAHLEIQDEKSKSDKPGPV
jgi:hypothetical protein